MVVVTMTKCPPKLRGDLSKWLLEINTGVYVGQVSARVRDALWKRICENISDGQATMVFNAQNEQHMDFYVHNTTWQPIDFDGIKLMKHPEKLNYDTQAELKTGYSNAAKRRIGKKRRGNTAVSDYILLDIETTGLSVENDSIIEIGIVKVSENEVCLEKSWLINTQKKIPADITKLTGIKKDMLEREGIELAAALPELFEIIALKTVMIYNASFDVSFLERAAKNCGIEFPEIKVKDILATARSRIKDIKDYRLDTVAAKLRVDMHNRHRAVDDCRLLNEVFHKLNEIQ